MKTSSVKDFEALNKHHLMSPSSYKELHKLHPELRNCFYAHDDPRVKKGERLPGIYSKFIHQPFIFNIDFVNTAHEERKKAAEKELANGSLAGYLMFVEKPYRMQELMMNMRMLTSGEEDFDLAISTWCNVENLHEYRFAVSVFLWEIRERYSESLRFEKGFPLHEDEDGFITVYRGYDKKHNPNGQGFSYSTSKRKAQWFAERFAGDASLCAVREIKVKREDIVFVTNRRNEYEVVPLCQEVIEYE